MPEPITPLDDRILEAFDGPDKLRDGLKAVYDLGHADALEQLQNTQTVNVMRRDYEQLQRHVANYDTNFPCDGGCNTNDGPEETCSRHGRSPKDLWQLVDDARKKLAEVRQYAEGRIAYGKRGRVVHSSRIGSDLLKIVDGPVDADS